jgi:hypothetical protein
MSEPLCFEQLMQEAWALYPQASTICGTEKPLQFWLNGLPIETDELLSRHRPVSLAVQPGRIAADGCSVSLITIHSPARANERLTLVMLQGQAATQQELDLDSTGQAELEICSEQALPIQISIQGIPCGTTIQVDPTSEEIL